jgi:hypothetical protein
MKKNDRDQRVRMNAIVTTLASVLTLAPLRGPL